MSVVTDGTSPVHPSLLILFNIICNDVFYLKYSFGYVRVWYFTVYITMLMTKDDV